MFLTNEVNLKIPASSVQDPQRERGVGVQEAPKDLDMFVRAEQIRSNDVSQPIISFN